MIVIPGSNKTLFVRHWLRWYLVQRGGTDWRPLKMQRRPATKSIGSILKSLEKGKSKSKTTIDK